MSKRNGFTLIELLVVIAIITILMAIIRPMLTATASKSRDMECESRLRQIGMAMHAYCEDNGAFPKTLDAVDPLIRDKTQLECVATGKPYYYRCPTKDAERDTPVASCIDPRKLPVRLPHTCGEKYLVLSAGGDVTKVKPQGKR
jgi:prepilin-type N-terminal cleavage/methylation domain-containing protein